MNAFVLFFSIESWLCNLQGVRLLSIKEKDIEIWLILAFEAVKTGIFVMLVPLECDTLI